MGFGEERLAGIQIMQAFETRFGFIHPDHAAMRNRETAKLGHVDGLAFAGLAFRDTASSRDLRIIKKGCIHRVTSCERDS